VNRFFRNILSNWTGMAVSMAVAFFMSPFLVHTLGDRQYGLWVLIISTTGYMGLLDVGLRVSVVKYVSQLSTVKNFDGLNRVVSTALAFYGGVGVVIMLITIGLEMAFSRIFTLDPSEVRTARMVLFLAGANVAATLVVSIPGGVLAGLQRYDRAAAVGIATVLVRSAAIVAFVAGGFGIVALGSVHLLSQVFFGVLAWSAARKFCPTLAIRPAMASLETLKQLWSYSAFVLVNNAGRFLLFGSGEIVAGAFLGTGSVTYYAIAGTVAQYMQQIVVTMTQVLHPHAAAEQARGSSTGLRTSALLGTQMSLLVGVPITLTAMIVGGTFIQLWMGPEYGRVAGPLLVLLTLARLVHLSQSGAYEVLLGMSRHRFPTTLNLVAGIVSVAGSVSLVARFGLMGIVIGGAVPIFVLHGVVLPWYTNRVLAIDWATYLRRSVLPPVLAGVPFAVALSFGLHRWPPQSLVALGVLVSVTLPLYAVTAFFCCFDEHQRRQIAALLPTRRAQAADLVSEGSAVGVVPRGQDRGYKP
jgi:O-antigen/teichoic acid export membrane protein